MDNSRLLVGTAIGLAIVGLIVWNRFHRRRLARDRDELRARLARSESQVRDQARMLAQVQRQKSSTGSMGDLSFALAPVIQSWNQEDVDPRTVPSEIVKLVQAVFEPAQLLYYTTRQPGMPGRPAELHLVHPKPGGDVPPSLRTIPFGRGKIGWAAENGAVMSAEDWLSPAKTDGQKIPDNHPALRTDLVGPLFQPTRGGRSVMGMLVLGDPAKRPRDAKLLFQLIADLGSMAQVNASMRKGLRERANTDGLTGLMNKSYFTNRALPEMFLAAHNLAQKVALFIFDIDHFKNYNDTNGHPAGDQLLRDLGAMIREQMRPVDLCCRYGGEEFIVAMPETDAEQGLEVADRIRQAIEDHEFPHRENQPGGRVTISGGVAAYPADGTDVGVLTQQADEALYQSKRSGRNRVTRYRGVSIGDADEETGFDLVATEDDPGSAEA